MNTKIFFLVASLFAHSGVVYSSTVSSTVNIFWVEQNTFAFNTNNTIISKPTCNTSSRYAVSLLTDTGRAIKDSIISAKNQGLSISIVGSGACRLSANSEDVTSIAVAGVSSGLNSFWTSAPYIYYSGPPCQSACSNAGAISVADSNGYVCKDSYGTLGKYVSSSKVPNTNPSQDYAYCGNNNAAIYALSQCYCNKR